MTVRRLAVALVACAGLLASAPADAAETYRMDGRTKKSQQYSGTLVGPAIVPSAMRINEPDIPQRSDCGASTCDLRELRIALPKGTSYGMFRATVVVEGTMSAALVLYNADGSIKLIDEPWRFNEGEKTEVPPCCIPQYTLQVWTNYLETGKYTLAIIDRAGLGSFDATVSFVAHRPDRKR